MNNLKINNNINRYIYHQSNPYFREKILEDGLLPQGKSDNWLADTEIEGKVIFASNTYEKQDWFYGGYDDDIYEIDTNYLNNIWYNDPNFEGFEQTNNFIITFDRIPPEAINILYKGTGENIDDTEFEYMQKMIALKLSETIIN